MVAHFKSLCISLQDSDSDDDDLQLPSTSASCRNSKQPNQPLTAQELRDSLKNGKKFSVHEEVLKLNTESLLPHLIKREKPCTALIPWKPLPSVEDLISRNQQNPLPQVEEELEDQGIIADIEDEINVIDLDNINNNNNNNVEEVHDQNLNDFDMEMD